MFFLTQIGTKRFLCEAAGGRPVNQGVGCGEGLDGAHREAAHLDTEFY